MTEELLRIVREEVAKKKAHIEEENAKIDRIMELEKNPIVSEYRGLRNLGKIRGDKLQVTDSIYYKAFQQKRPKPMRDTNGMYVLSYEGKYIHKFRIRGYRQYTNIESSMEALVAEDDFKWFEESNIILEGIGFIDAQKEFVRLAVETTQEEAIKVMIKKYGKKKESK